MTFRAGILGSLELSIDDQPVTISAAKPRALLALLLLERNGTVSQSAIIDGLWGEEPPATAAKAVQTYVSQLRKALGHDVITHRPPGYVLRVDTDQLDLDRFDRLVGDAASARESGDRACSAELLREALSLWRGAALEEFRDLPFAAQAIPALEESRLSALEARIDDDLSRGAQRGLVPELEQLVDRFPYRESLRGRLMLALYREGRQADALAVYRSGRELLVEELGLEPGRELHELEQAILRHDDALSLAPPAAGAASAAPAAAPAPAHLDRRRSGLLLAAAVGVAAVLAATMTIALTRTGSENDLPTAAPALGPFVDKLENLLVQSQEARAELGTLLANAQSCEISSGPALVQLDLVERSRQSLLDQAAALTVPETPQARAAAQRFHVAIQRSIAADWQYRRWLTLNERCPRPAPPTGKVDAQATGAKNAFLAVFNPLATRLGKRSWHASEF